MHTGINVFTFVVYIIYRPKIQTNVCLGTSCARSMQGRKYFGAVLQWDTVLQRTTLSRKHEIINCFFVRINFCFHPDTNAVIQSFNLPRMVRIFQW